MNASNAQDPGFCETMEENASMREEQGKLTPMLEQYQRIKAEYADALLFYRMGDFYELFFSDAVTASRELGIALTSRNKNAGMDVPMCGVPWHASASYIAQLVEKGFVVAICDQTEDPKNKQGKGLVARAVTQVITPGTILDTTNLEAGRHNYLGCVVHNGNTFGFVWADISTGQWTGAEFTKEEDVWQWVLKMGPRELILSKSIGVPSNPFFAQVHVVRPNEDIHPTRVRAILCQAQHVRDLESLGLEKKPLLALACAHLLRYLEQTQQGSIDQLEAFVPLNLSRRMLIDDTTERNLELFTTSTGGKGKGTLRALLRTTITPMGGRMMEDMLHHPWRERESILAIQEAVHFFWADDAKRKRFREDLLVLADLERLTQRIALNRTSPKDLVALRHSLLHLPAIYATLTSFASKDNACPSLVTKVLEQWDSLEDVGALLNNALVDDPPMLITEGGLFMPGYRSELDSLLDMVEHAQQKLDDLLARERERSGIAKLKLGYNRVFGYYYEVSKAVQATIPASFIRRQSLMNAERFTTEELKALEEALLTASEKRKTLEYTLFLDLRAQVAAHRERLLFVSSLIAHLDYWQALAQLGRECQWTMPTFLETPEIVICEGRHPVLESITGRTNFVPNDLRLAEGRSFCLLTGPNMSGKSTILRQTALIVILAQMGSMVPARSAKLGLVDKLFSRVGASDNLAQGESTFMVEMKETARILRQASKHSLVILDEIGRGTSTYDGVALAWAIVEYIVKRSDGRMRTLFATHYHELIELEGLLPEVFTMNVAIREYNGTIVFLHKLIPGPTDKSYGVEVARLAGIPQQVVQRAKELLARLETGKQGMQQAVRVTAQQMLPGIAPQSVAKPVVSEAPLRDLIKAFCALEPEQMTPMDALAHLADWKRRFERAIAR